MDIQLLPQLNRVETEQKIRVRLVRVWDSVVPGDDTKFAPIEMLLLDAKGNAMQASVGKRDRQFFQSILKEGFVYDMTDFYVGEPKKNFSALDSQLAITLGRQSKIMHVPNPSKDFPQYYFDFQSYRSLPLRKNIDTLLTDIIGVATAISRVLLGFPRSKSQPVDLQNVKLQDLNGNSLNVTLWGKNTKILNHEQLVEKRQNLILALAGMTVREFQGELNVCSSSATKIYIDPPITEAKLIKRRFEDHPITVIALPEAPQARRIASDDINENPMTIQQLLRINIHKTRDKTFTCQAKIIEIDAGQGWFYNCCNTCMKSLRPKGDKYECSTPEHGEQIPKITYKILMIVKDSTAEADFIAFGHVAEQLVGQTIAQIASKEDIEKFVLPNAVKALIHQERIFKVNLTRSAYQSGVPSFAVNRVFFPNKRQQKQTPGSGSSSFVGVDHPLQSLQPTLTIPDDTSILTQTQLESPDLLSSQSLGKPKEIRISEPASTLLFEALDDATSAMKEPPRKKIALSKHFGGEPHDANHPPDSILDSGSDHILLKHLKSRGKQLKKD